MALMSAECLNSLALKVSRFSMLCFSSAAAIFCVVNLDAGNGMFDDEFTTIFIDIGCVGLGI